MARRKRINGVARDTSNDRQQEAGITNADRNASNASRTICLHAARRSSVVGMVAAAATIARVERTAPPSRDPGEGAEEDRDAVPLEPPRRPQRDGKGHEERKG